MSRLRFKISMSFDGFVAGPGQSVHNPLGIGGMRLHDWVFNLASRRVGAVEERAGAHRGQRCPTGCGGRAESWSAIHQGGQKSLNARKPSAASVADAGDVARCAASEVEAGPRRTVGGIDLQDQSRVC
jgi:hypothetical protein